MKDFRQRKKNNYVIYSNLIAILLAIVLIFLIFSVVRSYKKRKKASTDQQKIENNYNEKIKEREYYRNELNRLTSIEGKKQELEESYNYIEPGVKIIKIVDTS